MPEWQKFLEMNSYAPQFKAGIERQLDFDRWGFRLAYAGARPTASVVLVYESPKCRVQFGYVRGRFTRPQARVGEGAEEEASYGYGRLHAPDEEDTVTIDGKEYVAWHYPPDLMNYLEYRNRRFSLEQVAAAPQLPLVWREIKEEQERKQIGNRLEAWAARIALSWERYAPELFDILDLRRPELWEGYRRFRQDLWEAIKSRKFATMGDRAQASIKLLSMVYDQEIA